MKLIIPMAGRGTRLRPHTHTTPKPLLPVAGKMLIERIVETFVKTLDHKITEIAFVLGDFGAEVENKLKTMTERFGATCSIYYQDVAMGTAHAVYCGRESMQGEIIVAFADTLFDVKGKVEIADADSVIWLKEVDNPSSFGVAVMDNGRITSFVEKPSEPVSNHAIIGVYYFKKGEALRAELENIVENDLKSSRGEYELTAAIDALLEKGNVFRPATVDAWLDCGTLDSWIDTTTEVLNLEGSTYPATYKDVKITEPVFIGENVTLENVEIGPNVSIEKGATIKNSTLIYTIVNENAEVADSLLANSTVGANCKVNGFRGTLHIGDHSKVG
jgi:glucose-1-phosphate thymidylyltransferase